MLRYQGAAPWSGIQATLAKGHNAQIILPAGVVGGGRVLWAESHLALLPQTLVGTRDTLCIMKQDTVVVVGRRAALSVKQLITAGRNSLVCGAAISCVDKW
eukprot:gene12992-biopygen7002